MSSFNARYTQETYRQDTITQEAYRKFCKFSKLTIVTYFEYKKQPGDAGQ